ncbi:Rab family GTPase [[Eubacterium] cellulosolvens]
MTNGEDRLMKKKICLIGDSRVGKTSLIKRYVNDEFDDKYIATIGAKISKKDMVVNVQNNGIDYTTTITLSIWDLIGHRDREYWSLLKRYYLNTDGALFVCDVTSKSSLENLKEWINSLFNTIGVVPFIIMANKYDLISEAEFSNNELNGLVKNYNTKYYLTSAKTGANVMNSFKHLSEIMAINTLRAETISDPKDILKEITSDFCVLHGGSERAMPIINHQSKQINMDITAPTKQNLQQLLERLTEVTKSFLGDGVAREQRSKYLRLVNKLK